MLVIGLVKCGVDLLTKVSFALQRYQGHPVKGVACVVHLFNPQSHQQSVGAELDVFAHQG